MRRGQKAGLTAHLTAIKAYNAGRRESAVSIAEMLMRGKAVLPLELWGRGERRHMPTDEEWDHRHIHLGSEEMERHDCS
jgi:hypothetical protein